LTLVEPVAEARRGGDAGDDERLAHLVLKSEWPRALCGFTVTERFGLSAPAMDRCAACLRIAAARKLGRPAWA
jgi:hypothetical protein